MELLLLVGFQSSPGLQQLKVSQLIFEAMGSFSLLFWPWFTLNYTASFRFNHSPGTGSDFDLEVEGGTHL